MKTKRFGALVFPLCLALLLPSLATAEGWSWPNLNPFGTKEASRDDSGGWSLTGKKPSTSYASVRKTEPSTWQKFSTGTSKTWNKTTTALNPWKSSSSQPAPKISGSRGFKNSYKPAAEKSKSTWYNPTTWFGSEEKPVSKGPGSVSDFISQPRMPY